MIAALIQGSLAAEPRERVTQGGKPYWTASLRTSAGEGDALFIGLSTFSKSAGARLMKLQQGDTVAAVGNLEQHAWTDREGQERNGWRLTAHEVLSIYEARKRRAGGAADADAE